MLSEGPSIVLTKYNKLQELENQSQDRRCVFSKVLKYKSYHYLLPRSSSTSQQLESKRPKKLVRSLSFSSILPTRKGKLKISKFDESNKLKCVEENSELTSFCDTLKRNRTLKEKVLNKNTVTETSMRRLSIVCSEIERFEREFVEPVKKTPSSLSLAFNTSAGSAASHAMRRHSASVAALAGAEKIAWKYLSTDSVATSGYSSAGLSRESTPDLSLRSEAVTEAETEEEKVSQTEKSSEFQINNSSLRRKPFCSTPRKPKRSHSEKLVSRCRESNFIRRSHTTATACGDLEQLVSRSKSSPTSPLPQHIYINLGCSADCKSKVTVNGLCYH